MTTTFIIAIDGPAASGKGTLSRRIAEKLGCAHMDTGALYRAAAWEVLEAGGDPADENDATIGAQKLLNKIQAAGSPESILSREELRHDDVAQAASKVAPKPEVRALLLKLQRSFAARPGEGYKGAVLDGRDIGTVVCPNADAKLFITASDEVRAQRRTKELHLRGLHATYEAVLKDMRERDARDAARKTAPMKPADDAKMLDTSALSPDEVLEEALSFIKEKLSA